MPLRADYLLIIPALKLKNKGIHLNDAHPLRVTQKQSDAAMEVFGHDEAASVSVQSVSLNDKPPSEDDVIF